MLGGPGWRWTNFSSILAKRNDLVFLLPAPRPSRIWWVFIFDSGWGYMTLDWAGTQFGSTPEFMASAWWTGGSYGWWGGGACADLMHPFLDQEALLIVTHALITSPLDFCNAIYMELPLKTTQKLQLVLNATAHTVLGVHRFILCYTFIVQAVLAPSFLSGAI